MARQTTTRSRAGNAAHKTGGARRTSSRRSYRRKKKPSRILAFFASIPTRVKGLIVKMFLGFSVLSASFPAVTEGFADWIDVNLDTSQLQSIMAIPVLGDILKRVNVPTSSGTNNASATSHKGALKGKRVSKELVRNPFA